MGQFYRTAKPTFVDDKMFQLPADLMYKTLLKNEKDVDEQVEKIDAFNETLKTENLKTDDPAVNERLSMFRDEINNYTDNIMKSPLDYRKYRGKIMNLSRDLEKELDSGLLGKAQEQYNAFNEEMKKVGEMKNVSAEKKDLLKQAIQKKYKDQGGLNFQDENSYNAISDLFETPLEDVDTDALINTIGQGWEADQTASASAGNTKSGYIVTSKGQIRIRDAEDVGKYVETSLMENGWEDQQRQLYKWKKEVGQISPDVNIDELVATDRNKVIEQAKLKLGFKQETLSKSMSGDSTWAFKQRMRQQQILADQGNIIQDKRDYRKTVNSNGQKKYSDAQVQKYEGYTTMGANGQKVFIPGLKQKMEILGRNIGVNDLDSFIDTYMINGNLNSLQDRFSEINVTKQEVIDYINYQKDVEQQKTPHIPGYDKLTEEDKAENPQIVASQQSYLNNMVKALNSMSPNDEVKTIKVWKDGVPYETNFKTVSDLVTDDNNFVFIPATSTSKVPKPKTVGGYLVDADGDIIKDANGVSLKTEEQAARAGKANDIVFDTQEIANYDTNENLIEANSGNIKQNDNFEMFKDGRIDNSKEIILTQNYFKVDKKTGKKELITVDIVTDDSDIKVQN